MNMIPTVGRLLPLTLSTLLAPLALAQTPLTFGNLVVVRVGDGAAALSTASAPAFLDEYTPTGTLVQTIALPTVASGSNQPFSSSGSVTSEGFLNVSTNGLCLMVGGYATAPGTATVAQTASVTVPRCIARVDILGNVDTSTALTDAYTGTSGNNSPLRSVVSDDGTRFWTSGTGGTGTAGIRYVANLGATTSTGLNAGSPTNNRVATIYNGQLYTTSASSTFFGVMTVGTGLQNTPGQPLTLLTGFPVASGPSPYDHFFADPNTLYVADDRTTAGVGGIQKWVLVAGTWTFQYALALPNTGCRGLTGFVQNGVTTLWATANYAFPTTTSEIVTVTDTGPASVVTSIAIAGGNQNFRGIRYLNKPTTLTRFAHACGGANINCYGTGELGTDVHTYVVNSAFGLPLIGYGLGIAPPFPVFVPFCNCTLGHEYLMLLGIGSQHTLNLSPSWGATIGLSIFVQAIDFLGPGGCPDPLATTTDTFQFTIQ